MHELLKQVIQEKSLEERINESINKMIDENSEILDAYIEDEDEDEDSYDTYEENYYFIKIIVGDDEYISTDTYTIEDFENASFEEIFSDQIDILPEEVLNVMDKLPNMVYEIEDWDIVYDLN